jgi:hypothetical protein
LARHALLAQLALRVVDDCATLGVLAIATREPALMTNPPRKLAFLVRPASASNWINGIKWKPYWRNPGIGHMLDTASGDFDKFLISLARPMGIEPMFPPWKGGVLDR